ncbi:MAG: hypothetical protein AB7I19_12290 [Planctomycetota bacterium]
MKRPPQRLHGLGVWSAGIVLAVWVAWMTTDVAARTSWSRSEILHAIRMVESGGRSRPPDGDGGLAIGPYQIHEIYWKDAIAAEPSIGGTYQDCRQRAYAERVIAAYMRRHAADAWQNHDAEVIARTHNGGPNGPRKSATDRYWKRVKSYLP